MRYWLIAIWTSWAAAAISAQPHSDASSRQALAAIDVCIERLDSTLDVGYERIAERCPQLAKSLEHSAWAAWLPRGWKEARNDLSAGSLVELRALVGRELETSSQSRAPSIKRLDEVLAGLGPVVKERGSLWSRFRAWLRTVIERNKQADERSWLDKMVQRDGQMQTAIDLLTYAALALIIVLAGVILVNEIRAAGLLKSRARAPSAGIQPHARQQPYASWRDVEQAPPAEKPRLLLELIIAKLTELRRIPPAGALTVRELTRAVELQEAGDRARLNEIASTAEHARYAASALDPEALERVVQEARVLLTHLKAQGAK